MLEAFNATLSNLIGSPLCGRFEKIWERSAMLRGKVYRVRVVQLEENLQLYWQLNMIYRLMENKKQSALQCLASLSYRKIKHQKISRYQKIRLMKRRIQMWKDDLFEELIQEAELCNKKMPISVTNMSDEKAINLFSGMIMQGKIRQALCFITDRSESGGILSLDDDAGKSKTVQQVLQSKHPTKKNKILVPLLFVKIDQC